MEKNTSVSWHLVSQKIRDYGIAPSTAKRNSLTALERLEREGHLILRSEMHRFLPKTTLDQYVDIFEEMVALVAEMVREMRGDILEKR